MYCTNQGWVIWKKKELHVRPKSLKLLAGFWQTHYRHEPREKSKKQNNLNLIWDVDQLCACTLLLTKDVKWSFWTLYFSLWSYPFVEIWRKNLKNLEKYCSAHCYRKKNIYNLSASCKEKHCQLSFSVLINSLDLFVVSDIPAYCWPLAISLLNAPVLWDAWHAFDIYCVPWLARVIKTYRPYQLRSGISRCHGINVSLMS